MKAQSQRHVQFPSAKTRLGVGLANFCGAAPHTRSCGTEGDAAAFEEQVRKEASSYEVHGVRAGIGLTNYVSVWENFENPWLQ